jgi:predicted secreted protein
MAIKLGLDAKLYYCAAGIGGTPVWTEVTAAKDVTCTVNKGEADVSTRGGGGWKATVGTLKDASIEFEVVYDDADEAVQALLEAFIDDTVLGLAVAKGDITQNGTEVFMADCAVLKFDEKEPLENAITISVTAKPTYSANQPQFKTIGSP